MLKKSTKKSKKSIKKSRKKNQKSKKSYAIFSSALPLGANKDFPFFLKTKFFFYSFTASQIFEVTQPPSLHDNLCTYEGYGEFVDPLSCNFYYACTNSRSIRMPCPHGLFFQPSSNTTGFCDYKRNVACTGAGKRPEHPVFVTTTTPRPTDPTQETVKSTYHPRNYH